MTEAEQKVLVVEDSPGWLKKNTFAFEELGATVIGAETVKEAIEALKAGGFTHVVSDGLKGQWTQVVTAAKEAGVQNITVLTTESIRKVVEKEEATYVDKVDFGAKRVNPEDILGSESSPDKST